MPAQLLGRKRHVLSSTFVGVVWQAQWFDEQADERRCRTIGSVCDASRERLRIRPASGGSNNTEVLTSLPLRVCMPSRVREAEGGGGSGS